MRPQTAKPIDRNRTCGQFEIVGAIGRGGAGIVYEARQPNVNRRVALKVLSAGAHAGPEQLVRFRAEAEAVGRLQHPNIVQIYEAGQQEGCPFLALEFVRGGSLRSRLNGAPQSPQASATLIETLARAMHAAHLSGIVHRDLKPANILFSGATLSGNEGRAHGVSWSADEIPKIADFGLAKAVSGPGDDVADALTQTGDLLGTPSYMSPEQASGHREQVGPTTDIYGLGAILYELLTGRPPFQGVTVVEVLQQVLSEDPVSPARLQPRLPRDLEIICLKCLEKQPACRYATALELADDLQRFVAGESIRARPVPRLSRLGRWCRRNPVLACLGGLVGVLAAALLVGSLAATVRLQKAARERLAEARLAEARAVRLESRLGRRQKIRTLLAEAARLHPSAETRNEAIAGMALFDLPQRDYGPIVTLDKGWVDFDGGLTRYARSDRDGRIVIARLSDGVEIGRLPEPVANASFQLSPDGQYLAVRSVESGALDLWSLRDTQPRLIHQDHCHATYALGAFDFSGDSRLIAVGRPDGTISIRSIPPGTFLQEWKHDSIPQHVAFRPHHSQIAVAGLDAVQVRDYETGQLLVRLDGSSGATWVSWHPAGRRMATVDHDQRISVWEPDERRRVLSLQGHSAGATTLRFNASGTLLCSQAWDEVLRFWDPIGGDLL
ncbi:MAG TPA: serine/threonine-protein kinase, partial [Planctomycetaceae bacterium]|nr:serine/threonine-protein kinase [Planctomycetaceae bacterium]